MMLLVPFIFFISSDIYGSNDSKYFLNKVNLSRNRRGRVNNQVIIFDVNDSSWVTEIRLRNEKIAELQNISISSHQSNFFIEP